MTSAVYATGQNQMEDVIDRDEQLRLPDFTLVSASAGCGKTTLLTHRFVQLLLSERIPHHALKNILAITFTNSAAAEMKERILEILKKAYLGDQGTLNTLTNIISLQGPDLAEKAGLMIEQILDHYSDFQVQTIDSFISRILKISSIEYGIAPDCSISIHHDPILDEAINLFFEAQQEPNESGQLIDRLLDLLDESDRDNTGYLWNPTRKIALEVKNIYRRLSSSTVKPIIEDAGMSLESLRTRILTTICGIADIATETGFRTSKRYEEIIGLARQRNVAELLRRALDQKVFLKSTEAGYAEAVAKVEAAQSELRLTLGEYFLLRAKMYYQPYARTHGMLAGIIERVKRQRGEMPLAEVTQILARHVDAEAVPEIYFSLGEQIHHYLIDEFQDTSPLQWSILRPLIENSLAEKGSLFLVGDAKQSIYGFRGADWKIMARMGSVEEFASVNCRRRTLKTNWRSTGAIVNFTSTVFHDIVPRQIGAETANMSGLAEFEQEARAEVKGKGHVEVSLFERGESEESLPPERQRMLEIIHQCRARGYTCADIAILTPKNSDVVEASRWLNEAGVRFLSHSNLDIRSRRITNEIFALITFLDSPTDDLSFATFLLGNLFGKCMLTWGEWKKDIHCFLQGQRKEHDREVPLYVRFRECFPSEWDRWFERLFAHVGYLPIYDLMTEIYATFAVFEKYEAEGATLVKLLQVIHEFEAGGNNNLKDFLEYAGEELDDSWNVDTSMGEDAVSVMTVHKAKGLGFPVLIVLFYDQIARHDNLFLVEERDGVRLLRIKKDWAERSPDLEHIYKTQRTIDEVDDLNKLYVALTRAKSEMYVLCVKSKRGDKPSQFLPQAGYEPRSNLPRHTQPFIVAAERAAKTLYPASRQVKQCEIKRGFPYIERLRGEIVHQLLSKILLFNDCSEGTLSRQIEQHLKDIVTHGCDRESISRSVQRFVSLPEILPFFVSGDGRTVLTEMEIVDTHGNVYRVDRCIVTRDAVALLEYKTGGEEPEHTQQLLHYLAVVQGLYPERRTAGHLAYVDQLKLIPLQ